MAGKFITFEGGEGSGKSTQARLLAERLKARGVDAVLTREPGGSPFAERVRALLLDPAGAIAFAAVGGAAVLRRAGRSPGEDHPAALAAGSWVICDRFSDSTRVYQGVAGGLRGEAFGCARAAGGGADVSARSPSSSTCAGGSAWRGARARRRRARQVEAAAAADPFERRDLAVPRAAAGRLPRRSPPPSRSAAWWSTGPRRRTRLRPRSGPHVERRLLRGRALMARAPAPQDDEELPEADRLEGFPHPRETRSLIGHEAAERELARSLRRRPHASRLADRGAGGHRQGDAGLSPRALTCWRGLTSAIPRGRAWRSRPRRSAARQIRALSHPGLLVLRRPYDMRSKRYRGEHSRGRGAPAQVVPRADGGGGQLARRDRRCGRRAQRQRRQRAAEVAGGAAAARGLFLLIASEPSRLLPTIRSRCRRLDLAPLGDRGAARGARRRRLRGGEEIAASAPSPRVAALERLAEGSVRRALSLHGGGGLELYERIVRPCLEPAAVDWRRIHAFGRRARGPPPRAALRAFFELFSTCCRGLRARARRESGRAGECGGVRPSWPPGLIARRRGLPPGPSCGKAVGRRQGRRRMRSTSIARHSLIVLDELVRPRAPCGGRARRRRRR